VPDRSFSHYQIPYGDYKMTTLLQDLRLMPIQPVDATKTALDYHAIEIDLAGDLNRQAIVDLSTFGIACKSAYALALPPYYKAFASSLPTVLARSAVADKLVEVNRLLQPYGFELLALDGYRPIDLQLELWNHFIEKGRQTLPEANDDELVRFAGTFCSDPRGFNPDDFRTWPVHNTGGAIDLTIRSLADGQEAFMGGIFDDADSISSTRFFENPTLTSQSAEEARRNRRLLYHAMRTVGFSSYCHEWWHFDLGTQMWVMNGGHSCKAWYGRATL
jgi:D-alanyl-D-alanine dipeptidase